MYGLGWLQPVADGPKSGGVGAEGAGACEIAEREIAGRDAGRGAGKRRRWNSSRGESAPSSRVQSDAYEKNPGIPPPQTRVSRHPTLPGSFLTSYFSCPFDKVLPLVRSRQVLLRDGKALLSPEQVPAALVEHFKEGLRNGVAVAERGLPGVERDERVKEILVQVSTVQYNAACFLMLGLSVFCCPQRAEWVGSIVPQVSSVVISRT